MKIVIEGPNGSGKSTLAKMLVEHFGLTYFHPGPKPDSNEEAVRQCKEQQKAKEVVMDRATCISRPVYGDNNEDPSGLGDEHLGECIQFLSNLVYQGTIFIHTTGRGEHQLKDYYTEEHIANITAKHEEIRERYNEIFTLVDHMKFDFAVDKFEDVVRYIDGRTKLWEMRY